MRLPVSRPEIKRVRDKGAAVIYIANMKNNARLFSILPALLLAVYSSADELAGTDKRYTEQILVTGTRLNSRPQDVDSSVSVITREQISRRHKSSAIDLLRTVPGLQISQQGGRGGVSILYLRGAEPNFTKVMIDGVEVNDPTNSRGGGFDFSSLELDSIDRIEVIHGAQSALYGSGGLAGVINIITLSGSGPLQQAVSTDIGRNGYHETHYRAAGEAAGIGYAFSAGLMDAGGIVPASDFENDHFNLKLSAELDSLELIWVGRYAESDRQAFPEDSGGREFAEMPALDEEQLEDFSTGLSLSWKHSDQLHSMLRADWFSRKQLFESPGIVPFIDAPPRLDDVRYQRSTVNWSLEWLAADNLQFLFGLDGRQEDGRNNGWADFLGSIRLSSDFDLKRDSMGGFVELRYKPGGRLQGVVLNLSSRYDMPDSSSDQMTVRLGGAYRLQPTGTTFRASYGEGFKLPSFTALGNSVVGNPDLLPETSETLELAFVQEFWGGAASLELSGYRNDYANLIDFELSEFRNVNRDLVKTRGGDFKINLAPSEHLSAQAYLSYVDTEVVNSDSRLRGRPHWHGGLNVFYQIAAKWSLNMDWLWNHTNLEAALPFQTPANPVGYQELSPHTRVDLAVRYYVHPALEVTLAVDNLFDQDYSEAVGFRAPGLEPRLGLQLRF